MSYFSTITLEEGKFVGTVYNSSNNQQVYKTQQYPNQLLATRDANNFIKNNQINNPISNSTVANPTPGTTVSTGRRCCGR